MTKRPSDPSPSRAPGQPRMPMIIAVVGALTLGFVGWWQERPKRLVTAPTALTKTTDFVRIDYFVDPQEWGATDPKLCDIARQYGLDGDALAATLYDYAGGSGCASPDSRLRRGVHVPIVVSARSQFPHCQALARRSCPRE